MKCVEIDQISKWNNIFVLHVFNYNKGLKLDVSSYSLFLKIMKLGLHQNVFEIVVILKKHSEGILSWL